MAKATPQLQELVLEQKILQKIFTHWRKCSALAAHLCQFYSTRLHRELVLRMCNATSTGFYLHGIIY
ncbi:MAG: hypothetical protein U0V75_04820 [Ferruginibacter sp.]